MKLSSLPSVLLPLGLALVNPAEAGSPTPQTYGLTAQMDARTAVEVLYRAANSQAQKDCPQVPQLQVAVLGDDRGNSIPTVLKKPLSASETKPKLVELGGSVDTHLVAATVTPLVVDTPIMNGFLIGDSQTSPEAKCFMDSAQRMNDQLKRAETGMPHCEVFGQDFRWAYLEKGKQPDQAEPVTSFLHLVGADCEVKR